MSSIGASFSALIRWRSRTDPPWEVDTRHPGFATAETAALVANGLGLDGLRRLVVERGYLFTVDADGNLELFVGEAVIWMMPRQPVDLPEALQFERVEETPTGMSAMGMDGVFDAKSFRVVDDFSGVDVDVRLVVRRKRVVVLLRGTHATRATDVEVPTA